MVTPYWCLWEHGVTVEDTKAPREALYGQGKPPSSPMGLSPFGGPPPAPEAIPEALAPSSDTHRAARRTLVVPCPSRPHHLPALEGARGQSWGWAEGKEFRG